MTARPRRSDAVDNRERIVAAARAALADANGSADELRLQLVARAAGVGHGTLYRHFPTREHLLAEVYRQELGELVDLVPQLLAASPPRQALQAWLARLLDYARVKRGVVAALEASAWHDLYAGQHTRLDQALAELLAAGVAAGQVRADVDAPGVILLLGALSRVPAGEWDARAAMIVDVVVRGLRTDAS